MKVRQTYFLLFFVTAAFLCFGKALAATSSPQTLQASVKKKPRLSNLVAVDQYLSLREDQKAFTQLYWDALFKINDTSSLRLFQGATVNYEVASYGENDIDLSDTYFYYYHMLSKDFYSLAVKLRGSFTLSLSEKSRNDDVLSRPSLRLEITRKFFDDKLSLSYRPFIQYHLNRYSTTVGGTPLKQWSLGHALVSSYSVLPSLKLNLSLFGVYHFIYSAPFSGNSGPPKGSYEFDLSLAYEWDSFLTTRVGFYQADSFIKDGRYELYLYDPAGTRTYIGVDVSF